MCNKILIKFSLVLLLMRIILLYVDETIVVCYVIYIEQLVKISGSGDQPDTSYGCLYDRILQRYCFIIYICVGLIRVRRDARASGRARVHTWGRVFII